MTNITESHNVFLLTDLPIFYSCGDSSDLVELVNANLQINTNRLKGKCLHIMHVLDSCRHWLLLRQMIKHIYSTDTSIMPKIIVINDTADDTTSKADNCLSRTYHDLLMVIQ